MNKRLMPSGNSIDGRTVAKVGGGKQKTPRSLAARMPSAEVAAKVGAVGINPARTRSVLRRNAPA